MDRVEIVPGRVVPAWGADVISRVGLLYPIPSTGPAPAWRKRMYGTIRRYKLSKPKEFNDAVNSSFINVVRKVPGFISYIAIDEGDGWWASLSLFETRGGILQSDRVAAEWVKGNAAGFTSGPPEITAGPVVVK